MLLFNNNDFIIDDFELRPLDLEDPKILGGFLPLEVFVFDETFDEERNRQLEVCIYFRVVRLGSVLESDTVEEGFAERELFVSLVERRRIEMEVEDVDQGRVEFILFLKVQVQSPDFRLHMSLP